MDRQIDSIPEIRLVSFLRMMFAGTDQRDPEVVLKFVLHRNPPGSGALHGNRRAAFFAQPGVQIAQRRHRGCKPPGFDLRFFVRRTHRHGCRQPPLADIDSRTPFRNYRDRDHTSSFLRQNEGRRFTATLCLTGTKHQSWVHLRRPDHFDNRGFPRHKKRRPPRRLAQHKPTPFRPDFHPRGWPPAMRS
jgi:hypothetical protein